MGLAQGMEKDPWHGKTLSEIFAIEERASRESMLSVLASPNGLQELVLTLGAMTFAEINSYLNRGNLEE